MLSNKRLIYILGAGRSGTTLLEIILSNGIHTFGIGEINRYCEYSGVPHANQEGSLTSKFWNKIKVDIGYDHDQLIELGATTKKLEYHTYPLTKLQVSKRSYLEYKKLNTTLYDSICENTKESVIIESSKYPGRLNQLKKIIPKDQLSIIYLKRDPISVVKSFKKQGIEQPPKGLISSLIYYITVNMLCSVEILFATKKYKTTRIKYEELTISPLKTITKIENDLELPLSKIKEKIKNNSSFEPSAMFDGNRIRMQKSIKIEKGSKIRISSIKELFIRCCTVFFYH